MTNNDSSEKTPVEAIREAAIRHQTETGVQEAFYAAMAKRYGYDNLDLLLAALPVERRLIRPQSRLDAIANAFSYILGFDNLQEMLSSMVSEEKSQVKKEITIAVSGNVPQAGASTIVALIKNSLMMSGIDVTVVSAENHELVDERLYESIGALRRDGLKVTLVD